MPRMSMYRRFIVLGVTVGAFAAVGCGSDDEASTDPAKPSAATNTPSPPKSYRVQVSECLEDVGYKTFDAGNARRVQSPGGKLIANIQTFGSQREAQAFARQLEVDGSTGGRGVAVFMRDADDLAKRVVTDCLTHHKGT